jgi:uncharacterized membrane protein
VAVTPAFMTALFGTAVACVAVVVWAVADWDDSFGPWLLAGAALYLVGTIGLTMAYHVPRNNALARFEPTDRDAEAHWRRYVVDWTRGNHVRVAAGLAAAAALTEALRVD